MRSLIIALQFLTIFPWPKIHEVSAQQVGQSCVFFPLVGLLLGLTMLAFDSLLKSHLPPVFLSIGLVLLMIVMTRGFHLDGLADTFDGLGARGGKKEALSAMKDSHTGVFGLLAMFIVLTLKFNSFQLLRDLRPQALLLAPVLGRWAMLVLAYRSESAAEGLGRNLINCMRYKHLLVGTVIAAVSSIIIAGALAVWIALSVLAFTRGAKSYFHRRLGGLTGDICGAVAELSETATLVILASVEWHGEKFS
jgi:adenosylcobinamide-GDP ribazoletransferase